MKIFYKLAIVTIAIYFAACSSDPNLLSTSTESEVSLQGKWYYQGESVNNLEFRSYQSQNAISIDENYISSGIKTHSYTLNTQNNILELEDGTQYEILSLTAELLTLNNGVTAIVLRR